jgi:hypothetical protein
LGKINAGSDQSVALKMVKFQQRYEKRHRNCAAERFEGSVHETENKARLALGTGPAWRLNELPLRHSDASIKHR